MNCVECIDISTRVANARKILDIPQTFHAGSSDYPIVSPQVFVFHTTHDLSVYAVHLNEKYLTEYPNRTVTFPTGGTWEEPYDVMAGNTTMTGLLQRRQISTIDEYYPIHPGDPNFPMSYAYYTDERIGKPHNLGPEHWIRPNGAAEDPYAEIVRFQTALDKKRFVVKNLGIGPDPKMTDGSMIPKDWDDAEIAAAIQNGMAIEGSPHIGFIPKCAPVESGVMYITLDRGTIYANKRYAPQPEEMPEYAISQGHADFRNADVRILAATGKFKQRNIEKVLFEVPSINNPASLVTLGETIVLLDADAATRVMNRLNELD